MSAATIIAYWSVDCVVRYQDGHTGHTPILTPGRTAQLAAAHAAEAVYERLTAIEAPVVGVQTGIVLGPIFKCSAPAEESA